MRRVARWTGTAFIVVACIAYQYLVHSSVSSSEAGPLRPVLMWLPLAAVASWAFLRSGSKVLWLTGIIAAGALVHVLEQQQRMGLVVSSGTAHAAVYLFLLWYFGRTLESGSVPLITRYARRVHGALQPGLEAYTRKLTIAWCVFFVAQLVASAVLFMFAPLSAWSVFINLFNLPLLAVMFLGDWAYRTVRHPDFPRASIWQAIQAFASDVSPSKSSKVC